MSIQRVTYSIDINKKNDGQKPTPQDLVNIGYMAGRFGINLNGNPKESNQPEYTDKGLLIDINSCTSDLLEDNLKKTGIKFNRVA